jgi:PSP
VAPASLSTEQGCWTCLSSCLHYSLQVKSAKAGLITPQLREALGMDEGAPPPWLINMQRYGPPPSYPDLPVSTRPQCKPLLQSTVL